MGSIILSMAELETD